MVFSRQKPTLILTSLMVLAGFLAVILFVFRFEFLSWDFRNNLWGPAYLLVHGQDPFRVYRLFPETNALWSPASVGSLFFLGYLPLKIATNVWLMLNIAIVMGLVFVFWWQKKPGLLILLSCLLLVFLSPVTLSHLLFGQASLLFVACSLAAAGLVAARRIGLAAVVMAVGLVKPQLAVLILPGMLVGVWRTAQLRGVVRFVVVLLLTSLVFLTPLWVGYPEWVDGYLHAIRINPGWSQPTLLWMLQSALPVAGVLLWIAAFGLALVMALAAWYREPPVAAAVWTLALTTLVSPYLWSYDFVLLVPFFLFTLTQLRTRLLVWGYSLTWLLTTFVAILIRLTTDNNDIRYWWIPWVVVLAGVVVSRLDTAGTTDSEPRLAAPPG